MIGVLLARVSTEEQATALPAQTRRLQEYATKMNFSCTEEHEFHESAWSPNEHQEMQRVLKSLENRKEVVAVVLDKVDRLTRDFNDSYRTIMGLLHSGKIEVHFPSDNLVLTRDSSAADYFKLGIDVLLAKYYSDSIRDNVRRVLDHKALSGEWPHKAPPGYKNITVGVDRLGKDIKDIVPDEERSGFIRRIYELRVEGKSAASIAKAVRGEGLLSAGKANHPYTKSQIEEILKNPFYKGTMLRKGNLLQHRYTPLVPEWLWDEAQQINLERRSRRIKTMSREFIFSGIIRCAMCGYTVGCDIKKERYVYLKCTEYGGKHGALRVNEQKIIPQILRVLESIRVPEDELPAIIKHLRKAYELEQRHYSGTIKSAQREHEEIAGKLRLMYSDRLEGRISPTEFDAMAASFKTRQAALSEVMASRDQADGEFIADASTVLELASRAPQLFMSSNVADKRRLLNFVVSNLELDGENLLIKLKAPFDAIAECSQNDDWLRRSGSNRRPNG